MSDPITSFEEAAEAFHKATGYLMPGKDVRAAMSDEEESERRELFKVWCAAIDYMRRPSGVLAEALKDRDDWKARYVENVRLTGGSAAVLIRERDALRSELKLRQDVVEAAMRWKLSDDWSTRAALRNALDALRRAHEAGKRR